MGFSNGYGWAVERTSRGTWRISHSGGNGYFYADFIRVDENTVVIFATNDYQNRRLQDDLLRLPFGEVVTEVPEPRVTLTDGELDRYAGMYRLASGIEFEVRRAGGGLEIPATDPEVAGVFVLHPPDAVPRERLARTDSVAIRIAEAMATEDFGAFRDYFRPVPGYEADAEVGFWTGAFRTWTTGLGDYRTATVLGTAEGESRGVRTLQTYVALRFAEGTRVIRFDDPVHGPCQRFFVETVSPAALPTHNALVPNSAREFVTYSVVLGRAGTVTFGVKDDRVAALTAGDGRRATRLAP